MWLYHDESSIPYVAAFMAYGVIGWRLDIGLYAGIESAPEKTG
jgi:hypothetical protein